MAKEKQFDRKNACHSARLLTMGIEIAEGKGVILDRTGIDRDFLMNIRMGNTDYDTIMTWLKEQDKRMIEAMKNSTIPEAIDPDLVDSIMKELRVKFYGLKSL